MSTIRLKRSAEPKKVPSFEQLELGELALNTYDGKLFFKREQNGQFAIRELGARDAADNVYYVTQNGSDENDGKTIGDAFATIHHALSVIPEGSTLYVKAGQHTVKNPVKVPAFVAIVGDSLRTTFVQPEFPDKDIFWVNNGSFLKDMRFNNYIAPSAAVSFPPDGSAGSIMCSPYVQNCTSYTTTGTGMRVDGSVVTGLRSMVVDAYTQYNQGGIGVHHLNRGNTQLVSIFTISCDISIMCESGGFCSLTNSNTSFGNYGLVSDGYSEALFSATSGANVSRNSMIFNDLNDIPYIQNAAVFADSGEVYTIKDATPIKVGQGIVTGPTLTNQPAELRAARTTILAQKEAIQKATVEFVKETYQTAFDETKCRRDTGEILDAVANDIALDSNYRTLTAGLAYTRANSAYLLNNQKTQTADAIAFTRDETAKLISDSALAASVKDLFNIIIDLLNKQAASTYSVSNNYLSTLTIPAASLTTANQTNAAAQLAANRSFLQAEVLEFINVNYNSVYAAMDQAKCSRDVGFIVDALRYDILYGGNSASVEVAKSYFVGAASQLGAGQKAATVAAYDYLATIAGFVILETTSDVGTGFPLQGAVTQNTANDAGSAAEVTRADTLVGITETYINSDGATLPTEEEPNPSALGVTGAKLTAYNDILAGKSKIVNDTILFVESTYVLLEFNQSKCYRDTGLIIEAVVDDMVLGTNYKSALAGRTYGSSTAGLVISDQKEETIAAIEFAKAEVLSLLNVPSAASTEDEAAAYNKVDQNFNLILGIIADGYATFDSSNLLEFPNPRLVLPEVERAKANIVNNKNYLIEEAIAYINKNYPLLGYNRETCERDVGLIIDAISYDMMFGSNFRSITAGRSYLRGALQGVAVDNPFTTTTQGVSGQLITSDPTATTINVGPAGTVLPAKQKEATISSFLYLKEVMKAIVSEKLAVERIESNMNLIVDIIQDGLSRVPSDYDLPTPAGGSNNAFDATIANVIANIDNNRDFITAEVKQFIENEFPTVSETYDNDGKCSRDIGYILDAVVYDLTYGGNLETLIAGRSYFSDVVAAADGTVDLLGSATVRVDIDDTRFEDEGILGVNLNKNNANTVRLTLKSAHGLRDGYTVTVFDVNGPIRLNAVTYFVKVIDDITIDIYENAALTVAVNAANDADYINGGYVRVNQAEVIATIESYGFLRDLIRQVGANTDVAELQNNEVQVFGSVANTYSASAATRSGTLVEDIITIIENDSSQPSELEPDLTWVNGYDANIEYPVGFSNAGLYTDHLILQGEKGDIQADVTRYIESNFAYDQATCRRDLGYIIDAVLYDALYRGNSQSVVAATQYYSGGKIVIPELQRKATGDALDHLEDRVGDVLRSNRVAPTQSTTAPTYVAQDTTTNATTITEILRIQKLFNVASSIVRREYFINDFIDVVNPDFANQSTDANEIRQKILAEKENLQVKTIKFIDDTFREFRFDEVTCRRDVGLILDAVAMDVALGTNYNSIIAGLSYQRGSAAILKVKGEQFPQTLAAIKFLKSEILEISGISDVGKARAAAAFDEILDIFENGVTSTRTAANALSFPYPVGGDQDLQDAHKLLQDNREFISQEIVAWIDDQFTNFTYDEAKCLRDTQLIIDAIALDTVLNTNYNTITVALAYQRANASEVLTGQKIQTIAAIEHLRDVVDNITELSVQGRSRSTRLIDTILEILDGAFTYDSTYDSTVDAGAIENIELNNPRNASQDQIDAKDQLRINKDFIATDVVWYVNNNYPNLTYVQSKCSRDVKFIIDAINFDQLYGGNSATVQAAQSYFVDYVEQLGTNEGAATIAAYTHLKTLIENIVICSEVVPQNGNGLLQKIESDPGTVTEVNKYKELIDIIIDVIRVGNLSGLPTPVKPTVTWADANLQSDYFEFANKNARNSFTPTAVSFTPTTGVMVLTLGAHAFEYGDKIRIAAESLAFTCASDGNQLVLRHPRPTDTNAYEVDLTVLDVTPTTITVNVGVSPETSAHTFVDASANAVTSVVTKASIADQVVAFVNDEFVNFTYDIDKCARDVGIITVGTAYDVALGTNYNAVTSGLAYQRVNANKVLSVAQKEITIAAYTKLKTLITELTGVKASSTAVARASAAIDQVISIFRNGTGSAAALSFPNPTDASTEEIAAKTQIQTNKAFIIDEIVRFIEANSDLIGDYDQAKCRRDAGLILDAVTLDMVLGTNYNSVYAGISYTRANAADVVNTNQKGATIKAIEYLRDRVLELSDVAFKASDRTANTTVVTRLTNNFNEVIDIITNGSPSADIPGDSTSAADAINFDVDGDGNFGPTEGTFSTRTVANAINAVNRLRNNKEFLAAEVKAFIGADPNPPVYDQIRCERDVKYIIDGIAFDLLYGGNLGTRLNARSYFVGNAIDQLPEDQRAPTASAYTRLATVVQLLVTGGSIIPTTSGTTPNTLTPNTSGSNATIAEGNILNDLILQIKNVVENNTLNSLVAEEVPNVAWANADLRAARDQALLDRVTILDRTIAYINQSLSYNQAKCERDTGFILDALTYDILYGGNSASVVAADAYFVGTTSQLGTNAPETTATIAAYTRLKTVVSQVVQGTPVTTSSGVVLTQSTSGDVATGTEAGILESNIDIIIGVLQAGNTNSLPSPVTYPTISWTTAALQTASTAILGQASAFGTAVNTHILATFPERTYDRARCKRDVGFIVDALSYDILYGGNSAIREVARSYFSFAINQLGQGKDESKETRATIIAYNRLSDVVSAVVQGTSVTKSTKNTETQDIGDSAGAVATSTEASKLQTLLAIVTNVIREQGVNNLPEQDLPSISWTSTDLQNDFDTIIASKSSAQDATLQYIEDRYTRFSYDQFKCSRDVGLILNAVLADTVMGGNYQSLLAGNSYYRASASIVYGEQLPETIKSIEFLRDEVKKILTDPLFTATVAVGSIPAYQRAITPVEAVENAKTTTKVYGDTPEYARLLARFEDVLRVMANGLVTTVALSGPVTLRKGEIVRQASSRAFGTVKEAVSNSSIVELISVSGDFNTTNALVASKTGALGVIPTSVTLAALDTLNFEAPVGITTERTRAKDILQANKEFFVREAIAFIHETFPLIGYDRVTCERDIGLILDALGYDIMFGSNFRSIVAGRAYYRQGAAVVTKEQKKATLAAFQFLKVIAADAISSELLSGVGVTAPAGTNTEFAVTVQEDSYKLLKFGSFHFDGVEKPIIELEPGLVYTFNQDAISNVYYGDLRHPMVFGDVKDGPLTVGGTAYETGVKYYLDGVEVTREDYVRDFANSTTRRVTLDLTGNYTTEIWYHSAYNAGMGNLIYTRATGSEGDGGAKQRLEDAMNTIIQILDTGPDTVLTLSAPAKVVVGEILTQANTGAKGEIKSTTGTTVTLINVSGTFDTIADNTLTGGASGALGVYPTAINTPPAPSFPTPTSGTNNASDSDILAARNAINGARQTLIDGVVTFISNNFPLLGYDRATCERDVGLVIDAISYDLVFGSNFRSVTAGRSYLRQNSGVLPAEQKAATTAAFTHLGGLLKDLVIQTNADADTAKASIDSNIALINAIINNGVGEVPVSYTIPSPTNYESGTYLPGYFDARENIDRNRDFLIEEVIDFIENGGASIDVSGTYDSLKCRRDLALILDAVYYDMTYGGNLETLVAARAYTNGSLGINPDEETVTTEAYTFLSTLIEQVALNNDVTERQVGVVQDLTGPAGTAGAAAQTKELILDVIELIPNDNSTGDEDYPNYTWTSTTKQAIFNQFISERADLQNAVTKFIEENFAYLENKCRRDLNYILDAVYYDMTYGGNLETTVVGRSYFSDEGVNQLGSIAEINATKSAYVSLRDSIYSTALGASNATVATRAASLIDDVINWIDNTLGEDSTNVIVNPDITWVDAKLVTAYNTLQTNKATIQALVTEFIEANYAYIQSKCERDIRYIIDAVSYDIFYLGNSQVHLAAEQYFDGGNLQIPVPTKDATVKTFKYIQSLAEDVVRNIEVLALQTSVAQNTSLPAASTESADRITSLFAVINNLIQHGYSSTVTFDVNLRGIPPIGEKVTFHQTSLITASGQTFEWVGSGTNINAAVPYKGGQPIQEQQVVESNEGKVYFTSTDQTGDFKIGNSLTIERATGTITGDTFDRSLFAVLTPYILSLQ